MQRGYDEVADAYAALETQGAEWPRMRHLRNLLSILPSGADVLDLYAIEHVPREEHGLLFERFCRWLRPGGRLLFTLEAGGDEPGRTREWLGVPMFFSYYDAQVTRTLLEQAGLFVERCDVESQLEGEREIEYVWFHACKLSN